MADHYPRFKHPYDGRYWRILGWSKSVKYILIECLSYPGPVKTIRPGSVTYERAHALLVDMGVIEA